MALKLITPLTTEPISLVEAKLHLRIDSDTLAENVITYSSISPGNHAIALDYSLIGTSVNVLGKAAIVNLNSGTNGIGGIVNAKIQESDDDTNWFDWDEGSFTEVTEDNDNAIQEKEYTGLKQYIRVVATVTVSACDFSADIMIYSGNVVEDSNIQEWITTAREYAEGYTGRAFATQILELLMESFPADNNFEIPMPPLQSITSIKYKNSSGEETTLTVDTDYIVDTEQVIGRIVLPYGKSWPSFIPYPINPIRVRFTAGYSESNLIPKTLKSGMLIHIGLLYKYRDSEIPEAALKTVKSLYNPYRMRWF